jgi:hypothetical protein
MQTVKLCTYTRGFYPTIWDYRIYTILAVFLVIVDGKIVKRSYSEMAYTKSAEILAEFDALGAGLEWIVKNYTQEETEVQILFCGAHRAQCKKIFDDNETYPIHDINIHNLTKKFAKVSHYSTARMNEANLYDMTNKIFALLYGDSAFNHEVIHKYEEDGIQKQILVGQPEIRWYMGAPKTLWLWS